MAVVQSVVRLNRSEYYEFKTTFLVTNNYVAANCSFRSGAAAGENSPDRNSDRVLRVQPFGPGRSISQRLRELGYVEGKNIVIEYRYAEGKLERLPDLAAELVRLKVDVIVTGGGPTSLAAKKASATIPMVFAIALDPVGDGLVSSVARPGGNITGLSLMAPDLAAKQIGLTIPQKVLARADRVIR